MTKEIGHEHESIQKAHDTKMSAAVIKGTLRVMDPITGSVGTGMDYIPPVQRPSGKAVRANEAKQKISSSNPENLPIQKAHDEMMIQALGRSTLRQMDVRTGKTRPSTEYFAPSLGDSSSIHGGAWITQTEASYQNNLAA